MEIPDGDSLAIIGPSGCGKSTLLRLMIKLDRPTDGAILVDKQDISRLSDEGLIRLRQKVGMIFQSSALFDSMNVFENVAFGLRQHGKLSEREIRRKVMEKLDMVELEKTEKLMPDELSGGMKQRIVIATALFLEPKIVICDEPTTALDVVVQAQIINLIKRLKKKLGLSVIFITHDLATEAEVADRLLVMYAGKLVEIGTNEQIYGKQGLRHPYTEKLLKASPRLHEKVEELSFIPGTPPDLVDPPSGCRFHPRCSEVMERCKKDEPPLIEVEPEHRIACWRNHYE